ncbi:hypothetical protein ACET3Z_013095 [Daucus carota]
MREFGHSGTVSVGAMAIYTNVVFGRGEPGSPPYEWITSPSRSTSTCLTLFTPTFFPNAKEPEDSSAILAAPSTGVIRGHQSWQPRQGGGKISSSHPVYSKHPAECPSTNHQDRLTHVQVPFTWNLSPLRPSKFSFEYLLLPPRSAPTDAPPRLTPKVSQRPQRPPTHRGLEPCPTAGYRSRA